MANYSSIEEMLNTTENMQHLVVSTGHDDDTMTFDGVDWFMFNGIKASSLYVSGNSWIGLGANTEQFLVCRRDAKMWDFYREEATLFNAYRVLKIRWEGYAQYNSTSLDVRLIYEWFFFETGDIMLNLIQPPKSSGYLGSNRINGGVNQNFNVTAGVSEYDQVVGKCVQTIIDGFLTGLEQLLGGKRNKDSCGACGHAALDLDLVIRQRQGGHEALLLLIIQPAQIAVVFLSDGACLEHIGFQLCLRFSGVHYQEGQKEHSLILALQLLQECLRILTVSRKVGRNDIHIVAGANCLFLFLNLAAVQLCNRSFDSFDSLILIHGLDVHGDNLTGFHLQKILQHLVTEVRGGDLQIGHGAVKPAHLKNAALGEGKAGRSNEVLHRHSASNKPFPVKEELLIVTFAHVEHIDSALLRGPADGAEKKSVLTDILVFSGNRGFLFPKAFQHGTDYMTGTSIFAFHRLSPSL